MNYRFGFESNNQQQQQQKKTFAIWRDYDAFPFEHKQFCNFRTFLISKSECKKANKNKKQKPEAFAAATLAAETKNIFNCQQTNEKQNSQSNEITRRHNNDRLCVAQNSENTKQTQLQ